MVPERLNNWQDFHVHLLCAPHIQGVLRDFKRFPGPTLRGQPTLFGSLSQAPEPGRAALRGTGPKATGNQESAEGIVFPGRLGSSWP